MSVSVTVLLLSSYAAVLSAVADVKTVIDVAVAAAVTDCSGDAGREGERPSLLSRVVTNTSLMSQDPPHLGCSKGLEGIVWPQIVLLTFTWGALSIYCHIALIVKSFIV